MAKRQQIAALGRARARKIPLCDESDTGYVCNGKGLVNLDFLGDKIVSVFV